MLFCAIPSTDSQPVDCIGKSTRNQLPSYSPLNFPRTMVHCYGAMASGLFRSLCFHSCHLSITKMYLFIFIFCEPWNKFIEFYSKYICGIWRSNSNCNVYICTLHMMLRQFVSSGCYVGHCIHGMVIGTCILKLCSLTLRPNSPWLLAKPESENCECDLVAPVRWYPLWFLGSCRLDRK